MAAERRPRRSAYLTPTRTWAGHGAKLSVLCRNGLSWAASSVLQFQEGILTPKNRSFGDWEVGGGRALKSSSAFRLEGESNCLGFGELATECLREQLLSFSKLLLVLKQFLADFVFNLALDLLHQVPFHQKPRAYETGT